LLIRVTNQCNLECKHCFVEGRTKEPDHMSRETFTKALNTAGRIGARVVLLSGGEPTLHPDIIWMLQQRFPRFIFILASNGAFVKDEALTKALLEERKRGLFLIQVTNDPRYYSEPLPESPLWKDSDLAVTTELCTMMPCRRVKEAGIEVKRKAPTCFNLRSFTRGGNLLGEAVAGLETNMGKVCSPSVNVDGAVLAGEMDTCYKLGTVNTSGSRLERQFRKMKCNRCGLVDKLSSEEKRAIGEAS